MTLRSIIFFLILGVCHTSFGKKATIRWSALKDAKKYDLEISSNGKILSTESTSHPFLRKALPPGRYSFRVRAVDSSGLEGQWTTPESIHIPLENPKPTVEQSGEFAKFAWNKVADVTGYLFILTRDGKRVLTQELSTTEYTVDKLGPGNYEWSVQSISKAAEAAGALNTPPKLNRFLIEAPPRVVASVTPPATVETTEKGTSVKTFALEANAYVIPYKYWTNASAGSVADAQGFSMDLGVRYQAFEKAFLCFKGGVLIQRINETNYAQKSFELGGEYETGQELKFMAGVGVRAMDWIHLGGLVTGHDNLTTLGPTTLIEIRRKFTRFTVGAQIAGYAPMAIVGQSNRARPWTLGALAFNIEPGAEISYDLSENFDLKGGVVWLPHRLNLTNGNAIENQGLGLFFGGQLAF